MAGTESAGEESKVSFAIDDNTYATAAQRYFGREQGQAWVQQLGGMTKSMVRIEVTPEWVGCSISNAFHAVALNEPRTAAAA